MVSRIIELCARNRFVVLLAVFFTLVSACHSMRRVKLDAIPDLSEPQVIIFTEWMGRSPTLVEDQITYPIVSSLVAAPHVTDVRGYSMFGMSFIYVIFEEGTDIYWARSRVLEYLNGGGIRGRLPEGVSPTIGPDATGIGWTFQYTLVDKSGNHGLDELRTFQDFTLRYQLGSVPGVAEVASVGGYQKQYQVTIDPDRLQAYGVTLQEVIAAIRESNSDVGGRIVELSGREYYVRGVGYVQDIGAIERVAIKASGGASGTPVLVKDIGSVRFGPEIRRGLLEWNGEGEAVGAIVIMRHGENALDVIARVKKKIDELRPSFPAGVDLQIAYDRSGLIDRSIGTLQKALIEEAITVAIVIALFLLHLRSSLLPILSIPVAVALSFIPMYLLGIPSTIMSLGGIAIAIGATVDAEIVMIEASHKKLEAPHTEGDRHRLLAEAAKEVAPAIFFSLLIIAIAFLPVFTLTGQAGRLFRPMAYTKTFVMLFSAILSITFAPALRDFLIRGKIFPERKHPISRALIAVYKPFVYVALRSPKSTIAIGLLALISAVPLAAKLGSEFMPPLNEGDLLYMPITFPNISIEEAKRQLQAQDRILRTFPEVESVFGKVGRAETPTDPAPLTMVETTVRLKPANEWRKKHVDRWYSSWAPGFVKPALSPLWPEERPLTWDELTAEMNQKMQFPGWTNAWTMPIKTRVDMLSTGIRTPIGIKVQGTDLKEIERVGVDLERILSPIAATRSVLYERNLGGLYLDIVPDRDALSRYGLRVEDVQRVVEASIGGTPIATTVEGRNRFSINVRYPRDLRTNLERLRRVLVPLAMGPAPAPSSSMEEDGGGGGGRAFVPLSLVADIKIVGGPPMVRDEGGLLVGYVYVDIDQGQRDIGGYVDEAKRVVADAQKRGDLRMPTGYALKWTGQYELLQEMTQRMKIVIPVTLIIILFLLYFQFKNLTEAFIVLLSIPFALVGSTWLMWILDYRISTAVWVGVIALIGLAAQTGIVMIVYINQSYEKHLRATDGGGLHNLNDVIAAHMEGTVLRVRPKVMTVATMLIGLVPLLWATGSGADVMKRVAVPMIGGLITSAFLTLEIIPVVITYWRTEQILWRKLGEMDADAVGLLRQLKGLRTIQVAAWLVVFVVSIAPLYIEDAALIGTSVNFRVLLRIVGGASLLVAIVGALLYAIVRRPARRKVWPPPVPTEIASA